MQVNLALSSLWKCEKSTSFCSFDLRLPCFSLIPNMQEDIQSMQWKTANKGLTLDSRDGKERFETWYDMGAFVTFSGYSVKKEATENTAKSRQMSSLGCDEWTSYRVHPILWVQDVLLHMVRLGLHASDEYGQIIGLSPAWEHRRSSAQLQHSTKHRAVLCAHTVLLCGRHRQLILGWDCLGLADFFHFFSTKGALPDKTFAITSACGSAKGERWQQEQEVSLRLLNLFDLYLTRTSYLSLRLKLP